MLIEAVARNLNLSAAIRELGKNAYGGTITHYSRRIKALGIDTTHFKREAPNKGVASTKALDADVVLVYNRVGRRERSHVLRRAMLSTGMAHECRSCGIGDTWNSKPIVLQIEHKDGDPYNNVIGNLEFLCPNCHSQTPTYCRRKG